MIKSMILLLGLLSSLPSAADTGTSELISKRRLILTEVSGVDVYAPADKSASSDRPDYCDLEIARFDSGSTAFRLNLSYPSTPELFRLEALSLVLNLNASVAPRYIASFPEPYGLRIVMKSTLTGPDGAETVVGEHEIQIYSDEEFKNVTKIRGLRSGRDSFGHPNELKYVCELLEY